MTGRMLVAVSALGWCLSIASPSAAEDPPLSVRVFGEVTEEAFAAKNTFSAIFGTSTAPFLGGGVQITILDEFYGEVSASQRQLTGSRVSVVSGIGPAPQVFNLGIPMTATITPIEVTGGFRFRLVRHGEPIRWVRPYAGAGIVSYSYSDTCTATAATCAAVNGDFSVKRTGFVLNGGAEFRFHRYLGVSAGIEFTRISGVIGQDGASQAFSESDLGGLGGRFRIVLGR